MPEVTSAVPQVDIVVVVFNQLLYTQMCLDSIKKHTDRKLYRLIVVDNGSLNSTRKYLAELYNKKEIDIVVRFEENGSVAKAYNEALSPKFNILSEPGKYVCFLHNDCLVTSKWLDTFIAHFERDLQYEEEAAVMNPMTNYAAEATCVVASVNKRFVQFKLSNKQKHTQREVDFVLEQTYNKSLDDFAIQSNKNDKGAAYSRELSSFCMFFRRKALDFIKGFDERFSWHGCEYKDAHNRLQRSGYEAWLANDVFVHHFGNITSDGPGFNLQDVLQKHEQLLEEIQIQQQQIKLEQVQTLRKLGPKQ